MKVLEHKGQAVLCISMTYWTKAAEEAMMTPDDKQKIIEEEEKLPKIQIVKKAVEKKPWCASGAALCVALLAVLISLGVLVACMGYFGVLPEKVRFIEFS